MAIQLENYETPFGFVIPYAYCRLDSMIGDKYTVTARVRAYTTPTAFGEGKEGVLMGDFSFTPAMDADNYIAQGYGYLMTLPLFSSGTWV